MEVTLVTGFFTILGIFLGFLSNYFIYSKNINLQNKKLSFEIEQIKQEMEEKERQIEQIKQENERLVMALQNSVAEERSKYLSSLINELSVWQGGLGLGRTVELEEIYVWVDLENQGKRQGTKIRDSELLRDLVKTKNGQHQNALIVGGPGSGKSTLIRRWAYTVANDALNKSSEYMPFYIPLNIAGQLSATPTNPHWEIGELAFKQIYGLSYLPKDDILTALQENIAQGKAIIFLDAADEVPEDKRDFIENWINSLSNYNPRNLVILTSRPSTYADQMRNFEKYDMVDFGDEQITDFVERWFSPVDLSGETKKKVIDFVFSADRVLKSNPLYLTMLCVLVEIGQREKIPTAGALFERFVRELLKYWPEAQGRSLVVPIDVKLVALQSIAYKLFEEDRKTLQEERLLSEVNALLKSLGKAKKGMDATQVIQEITESSGILRAERDGFYSFYHPLFQEFFIARKIKSDIQRRKLDLSEWYEAHSLEDRYMGIAPFVHELLDLDEKEQ